MPLHIANLTVKALQEAGIDISEAKVAVLGYAYLENSDDTRNSPSEVLVKRLEELEAEVIIHDPYVSEYQGDLFEIVQGCDAIVVMVAHDAYKIMDFDKFRRYVILPVLIDGCHLFSVAQNHIPGWEYYCVGM